MLDGDPSFVSYDKEIVENLGLDFEVVVAGSEAALISELDTAYQNEEPLLFYWYTPHWGNQKYDLTEVALPEVTEAVHGRRARRRRATATPATTRRTCCTRRSTRTWSRVRRRRSRSCRR